MPIQTAATTFVPPSIDEQREAGSQKTGYTAVVTDKRNIHKVGGRTAVSGEIDPGKAPGRMQDKRFEQATEAMRNRHRDTNIRPVTLINLLPIPLVVNSPMTDMQVRIPACMKGDGFTSHTWEKPAIEVMYVGEGVNMPYDFMPRSVANAYVKEYAEYGGVFAVEGYAPESEELASPEVKAQFAASRSNMQAWKIRKTEEGNGMWNTVNHSGERGIGDIHRECAHSLFEDGILPQLPPWIQSIRTPDQVMKSCPTCGTVPNMGAVKCLSCHEILDPAKAFLNNTIDENHASLEKLTRAQVIELGISAFVAETSDERPARLDAGLPRPKSLAQRNADKRQADADARARQREESPRANKQQESKQATASEGPDTSNM